jgi:uncharacterized protein with HEPN domain
MIDNDRLYLTHIAERIDRIEEYAAPGRNHFMANHQAQDAIMRNFEIIGEAVKRLSDQVLDRTPDVPWREVAGFRDMLIHGYTRIDLEEVWAVITNDLPSLKEAVDYLLR